MERPGQRRVMDILFLTENFPPETNAAATRVYERAVRWIAAGHGVTVITSAPNWPDGRVYPGYRNRWRSVETVDGIRVVRVRTFITPNKGVIRRTLDFTSFMAAAFVAGLFERRPDVVAATSPQFFTAVAGWALAKARGLPFVFEASDLWPASIPAVGAMQGSRILDLVEKLELFLYRQATAIVVLSPAFKSDLAARGIDAGKIAVVLNGVEPERYAPRPRDAALGRELGLPEGAFVAGYAGTHGLAHALEKVLLAAERLKDDPRIRILFVGAGATRDNMIREARRLGLDNVVFAPMQPKSRMPSVWSVCGAALVNLKDAPLFAEVIPSKMFEAMAMGLPLIVAAPEGEATRLLERWGAGLAVPPEDPERLADAIRRLAGDADLRKRLGAAGREAAQTHTRARQARIMLAVLEASSSGAGATASSRAEAAEREMARAA